MQPDDTVSIERLPVSDDEVPSARVLVSGVDTGTVVEGAILEAAVSAGGRRILFLTSDTPFEESLSIHLLEEDGRVADSATIGAPYATGVFTDLKVLDARRLSFSFTDGERWILELLGQSAFRMPLVPEAPGVMRPFGFSKRFSLSRGTP